ncbi:hypothetical protein N9904_03600, partial [Akkermansiaceae bacterium]|nr:hypothetical protein [Akkermansiaceae bacterium]
SVEVLAGGDAQVTFTAPPGTYALDYSLDLIDGGWLEVSDSETIEAGETTKIAIDNVAAPDSANTKVFYRVRVSE